MGRPHSQAKSGACQLRGLIFPFWRACDGRISQCRCRMVHLGRLRGVPRTRGAGHRTAQASRSATPGALQVPVRFDSRCASSPSALQVPVRFKSRCASSPSALQIPVRFKSQCASSCELLGQTLQHRDLRISQLSDEHPLRLTACAGLPVRWTQEPQATNERSPRRALAALKAHRERRAPHGLRHLGCGQAAPDGAAPGAATSV